MLNIISLTALRNKVTGPGKVVKNLMKGLDRLKYPYVLNKDFSSTERLWIHDDFFALKYLSELSLDTKCIIGPNLYPLPRSIPEGIHLEKFPHLMPALWVVDFWKKNGYDGILDSWPVGIDTEMFVPSGEQKSEVVIYFKQRFEYELGYAENVLVSKKIKYCVIRYGNYSEKSFQDILKRAKYVIWIGCTESQGIALGEILSSGIPVLLWDIHSIRESNFPSAHFIDSEFNFSSATSAPYFDETCGIRFYKKEDFSGFLDKMEEFYDSFSPREYILDNLSLEGQAKNFLSLYEKYYSLSWNKEEGLSLKKMKSFRNNLLITTLFDIYDSPFGSFIRKIIGK